MAAGADSRLVPVYQGFPRGTEWLWRRGGYVSKDRVEG